MIEYATLGEIVDQVGLQIMDTSTDKKPAIRAEVNRRYSMVARGHRWKELLRISEEDFSFSVGQKYLYLPKEVEQVYLIFPQNAMPPLEGRSLEQLIEQFSGEYDQNGLTIQFAEAGEVGYRTDFSTSGERLVITHTGTGTIEAVVHGMVTAGEGLVASTEKVEIVSVLQSAGGTTTNTFTDLIAVSVQALADDDIVSVVGNTSGTTYAVISAGERTARYKRIRLMQPPQTADAVTLIWKKRVARLSEDNQVVEIPVGSVLVDDVVATMLSQAKEYSGASLHYQRASRDIEDLKAAVEIDNKTIVQAIPGMSLRRGYRHGGGTNY